MVLVLLAAACVLAAPVAGRFGATVLANGLAVIAAACGVGSFGVAAAATVSAARRGRRGPDRQAARWEGSGPDRRPVSRAAPEPDRHASDRHAEDER